MSLKMFDFIENVGEFLESLRPELEVISKDIEIAFTEILIENSEGYLNISTRVKSSSSLKEKILRNGYYKKYDTPEELISNFSDLIGIRIDCRFIEDEKLIYRLLKKHFNKMNEDGYYYNSQNKNIKLNLLDKQPQEQKNGFEIYRIDGFYEGKEKVFNFELQIKSLVNIFWGEIEHKVIYKNNNYTLGDKFFKEMLGAIKKNLTMIDNQLLIMYDQFSKTNDTSSEIRKIQMETVLSKIIYDIFSKKVTDSIGFKVNFKKSCDIIMKYILRTNNAENLKEYNDTLIKTLSRLNDISRNKVYFNTKITFEREITFEDEFSKVLGNTILDLVNSDFQWNLFFKILFEIELGNNAEDFENFLQFLRKSFYDNKSFFRLYDLFEDKEVEHITEELMMCIAYSLKYITSIDIVHENNIEYINEALSNIIELIVDHIESYEMWKEFDEIYVMLFKLKILSIFEFSVDTIEIKELIEMIRSSNSRIIIKKGILKYIGELDSITEIKAEDALKIFNI